MRRQPPEFYGTYDAADYLGMSRSALQYHLREGHLFGRLVGKTLVFTQDELDEFAKTRRGPGRPRKG